MDIRKYLSAEQIAELEAMSKNLTALRTVKLPGFAPDLSSLTIDPAIYTHVF